MAGVSVSEVRRVVHWYLLHHYCSWDNGRNRYWLKCITNDDTISTWCSREIKGQFRRIPCVANDLESDIGQGHQSAHRGKIRVVGGEFDTPRGERCRIGNRIVEAF
jgi:hypothetical protein